MSRSTWACELKFLNQDFLFLFEWSRSTWACELKYKYEYDKLVDTLVTLHVSVWVEMPVVEEQIKVINRHAPRERVSWNSSWQVNCKWLY